MDFTTALLTFGVILLLVGIVGKVQAKELSIGTDSKVSRVVVAVLGAVLIAVSFTKAGIDIRDPLNPGNGNSVSDSLSGPDINSEPVGSMPADPEPASPNRPATVLVPQKPLINIIHARYGASREYCDPTERIKAACQDRASCSVHIDNSMCGDPLYGTEKEAVIDYECGDEQRTITTAEEATAILSCD